MKFAKLLSALVGVMTFSGTGCAVLGVTTPKETVRDIFALQKDRRFDDANLAFDQSHSLNFEVYQGAGGKVPPEEIKQLIGVSQSYFKTCDDLTRQVHGAMGKNDDGQYDYEEIEKILLDAQKEFKAECEFEDKSHLLKQLDKIKRYSTVDLASQIPEYKNRFYSELSSVKTKLASHKSQDDAAETKSVADQKTANDLSRQREEAARNTPEAYSARMCEMQAIINAANAQIQRESDGASVSGFVNKKKMYDAGQAVASNQRRLAETKKAFQRKFGREWTASQCK